MELFIGYNLKPLNYDNILHCVLYIMNYHLIFFLLAFSFKIDMNSERNDIGFFSQKKKICILPCGRNAFIRPLLSLAAYV